MAHMWTNIDRFLSRQIALVKTGSRPNTNTLIHLINIYMPWPQGRRRHIHRECWSRTWGGITTPLLRARDLWKLCRMSWVSGSECQDFVLTRVSPIYDNARGEPTTSYRSTGWVCESTQFKTSEKITDLLRVGKIWQQYDFESWQNMATHNWLDLEAPIELWAIVFCNALCNRASMLKYDVGVCTHF